MKIAPISEKEKSTTSPKSLKGMSNNQMIGYNNKTIKPKGQHTTNKIHKSKKLIIIEFFYFYYN